jgi:ketosteroid isomerase-like protein
MYHFVVRQQVRRAFRFLNEGRYEQIVSQFAARHRHAMFGQHALGGERRTIEGTAAWYGRLRRLLADLRFDVHSIAVSGWPWDTRVLVSWADAFTLPDGSAGNNQGVHELRMAWGKVVSLEVHCDTAKLEAYCGQMREMGLAEAGAEPICDVAW